MMTDFEKAREMAPTIRTDINEQRKVKEAETRWDYIKQVDDQDVLQFNTQVRDYNERRQVYDSGVHRTVAAWSFVGACFGGVSVRFHIGFAGGRRSCSLRLLCLETQKILFSPRLWGGRFTSDFSVARDGGSLLSIGLGTFWAHS